jgi:hypothetical protein
MCRRRIVNEVGYLLIVESFEERLIDRIDFRRARRMTEQDDLAAQPAAIAIEPLFVVE